MNWGVLTAALTGFFTFAGIPVLIIIAACYVFRGIGLYEMMKKRDFKRPWFAWVPVMCDYSMGLVYDDIRKKSGKERSGMRICMIVVSAVTYAVLIITVISLITSCVRIPDMSIDGIIFEILFDIIWVAIFLAIFFVLQIGLMVLQYIVLFKIYKEYSKNYLALFILTLVIYLSHPFVLFALRRSDSENKSEI